MTLQLATLDDAGHGVLLQDAHGTSRAGRWRQRTRARAIAYMLAPGHSPDESSPLKRLKSCGRAKAPDVVVRVHNGHAHASGLMACGNIWTCPTCAARIRARRELEVESALSEHTASGGTIGMLTLTLRHDKTMRLADSIDRLNAAWESLQQRRRFRRLRHELAGTIATLEITYGDNGWHPHLHIILLAGSDATWATVSKALDQLRKNWSDFVNKTTDRFSLEHGLNLVWFGKDSAAAARYVTKLAKEITLAHSKGGRDPFTLLDDDSEQSTALFIEYAHATYRRQCHRWSAGLKTALAVPEVTDEELAEDNDTVGVEVFVLDRRYWNSLTDTERLTWLEYAEVYHYLTG